MTKQKSQIDHILINGKWRRSLQDVRTKRHADTGCDQPCGSCLGSEAENCQAREKRQKRYNVARLTDPDIKQKFNISLKNSYSVSQNEAEMTIHAFNQESRDINFGYWKTQKEEWISQLTCEGD